MDHSGKLIQEAKDSYSTYESSLFQAFQSIGNGILNGINTGISTVSNFVSAIDNAIKSCKRKYDTAFSDQSSSEDESEDNVYANFDQCLPFEEDMQQENKAEQSVSSTSEEESAEPATKKRKTQHDDQTSNIFSSIDLDQIIVQEIAPVTENDLPKETVTTQEVPMEIDNADYFDFDFSLDEPQAPIEAPTQASARGYTPKRAATLPSNRLKHFSNNYNPNGKRSNLYSRK